MSEYRAAIVRMHENGVSNTGIANLLKIPRSTVIYQLDPKQPAGVPRKKGSGHKRTVRTLKNIRKIKGRLQINPSTKKNSVRKLAKSLNLPQTTVFNILKKNLKKNFYKNKERQLLTEKMKETRLKRAKALKIRFAAGRHRRIVFTDEKLFTVEEAFNPQNDGVWADELPSSSARIVERSQKPESVMVWGGITHNGKTPLVFIEEGVKVNQENYRTMLEGHLTPWAEDFFGDALWIFQQDSAPAHKAKLTQEWLRNNVPEFITVTEWPPYSPDLNPLDYSIWSIIESRACAKPHKSIKSLKRALVKAWNELDLETISRVVDDFPKRLQKCIEAKGGHFE